ncbi:hypothetical protein K0M31_014080 [Melipona bicolor]|uniref:Uncharacterized protein n=1 Tax=Melipona bicolor TaxID=60889 RepID=A0AA40G8I7_9HYME|nr:hypothetical protein K0M31_014080 [Melipona bicolor]
MLLPLVKIHIETKGVSGDKGVHLVINVATIVYRACSTSDAFVYEKLLTIVQLAVNICNKHEEQKVTYEINVIGNTVLCPSDDKNVMRVFVRMYVRFKDKILRRSKSIKAPVENKVFPPLERTFLKNLAETRDVFPVISHKRNRFSPRVRLNNLYISTDRIEQPVSRGTRQAGKNVGRQTFSRDTESRLRMHAGSKTTARGTTGSAYEAVESFLKSAVIRRSLSDRRALSLLFRRIEDDCGDA